MLRLEIGNPVDTKYDNQGVVNNVRIPSLALTKKHKK